MKTIFITISRGMIARNFLLNELYAILAKRYKIILLTPAAAEERFTKTFAHPNVEFVDFQELPWGWGERIIATLLKYLMLSDSVLLFLQYGIPNLVPRSRFAFFKYAIAMIVFKPLRRFGFLKTFVRFLDYHCTQKKQVRALRTLIRSYTPSFILSLNVSSDAEVALAKAARREHVPVWSMPKSWDNLGNGCFRIKTEKLLVWNEFMKEQALHLQHFKEKEIEVIGVPQFDMYLDPARLQSREEFCASVGFDPRKKIILFATEGKCVPADPEIAEIISEFVRNGQIVQPAQLFIRPHFAYKGEINRVIHLKGLPGVYVDTFFTPSPSFKDNWDYCEEFTNRFVNTLYHADVVVNTISTLALDVSIFDKPLVSIGFDGRRSLPFEQSVRQWYGTDHGKELMQTGGLHMVQSPKELLDAINAYLENPSLDAEGRQRLRRRLCGPLTRNIGQHLAAMIRERVG